MALKFSCKSLFPAVFLMVLAVTSITLQYAYAEHDTSDKLILTFISAINNSDWNKLKRTVHDSAQECSTGKDGYPIRREYPAYHPMRKKYKSKVISIESDSQYRQFSAIDGVAFAIMPTHRLDVSYQAVVKDVCTGKQQISQVANHEYLVFTNNFWYLAPACYEGPARQLVMERQKALRDIVQLAEPVLESLSDSDRLRFQEIGKSQGVDALRRLLASEFEIDAGVSLMVSRQVCREEDDAELSRTSASR